MDIERKEKSNFITDWVMPIITALIITTLIHKFVFINVFVPTGSMIPTINLDDKVCVTRIYDYDSIKRGSILVFYSDECNERLIKRVIGLPGDHVEITHGKVKINGEEIKEDYVKNNKDYSGTFDVPEEKYLFLGDNRAISFDARSWQNPYIDKSKIEGKAQFIFFPFSDAKKL